MDYEFLFNLKRNHATLRLLAADNSALIVSFLYLQFVAPNRRGIGYSELHAQLDDYLYYLHQIYGDARHPKSARDYLLDWSDESSPYLRKYYPDQGDEAEFDLTPATEKAIEWIQDLQAREFVGTESRLLLVFRLLREIVQQTEQDPQTRITALVQQRAEIDEEISRVRSGQVDVLDTTQVRERFFQAEDMARKLLVDFRQVEFNFRDLDRQTREKIALSEGSKGKMLDDIFFSHDEIRDSDQGCSFRAFWEFLMSAKHQAELDRLLNSVYALDSVQQVQPSDFLQRMRYLLLEAGEKVYQTNHQLVDQLRKYLDDQTWLENKRIMEIIHAIEKRAITVRDAAADEKLFAQLDELKPGLDLVMSRNLFTPPGNIAISTDSIDEGEAQELDVKLLFEQTHIDLGLLQANVKHLLQRESQVSLRRVVDRFPISQGVAELVGYVNLATRDDRALIDADTQQRITVRNERGKRLRVKLPRIVFVR